MAMFGLTSANKLQKLATRGAARAARIRWLTGWLPTAITQKQDALRHGRGGTSFLDLTSSCRPTDNIEYQE